MSAVFPSKVDRWAAALLVGTLAVFAAVTLDVAWRVEAATRWLALIAVVLPFPVVWLVAWPAVYEVGDADLVVRSGRVLRWHIPIATILSVTPTRNPLSSPAWSLDRLEIRHERGTLLVSPRHREAFLEALRARNPALIRDGAALRAVTGG